MTPVPVMSEGSAEPGSDNLSEIICMKKLLFGGAVGSFAGPGVFIATPKLILSILGFGAAGVAKGSIAASIHSVIGSVSAGSLFATAQSTGAVWAISWTTIGGMTLLGTAAGVTVVVVLAVGPVVYNQWIHPVSSINQ